MTTIAQLVKDAVVSNEAVAYQYNAALFEDLMNEIGAIRNSFNTKKDKRCLSRSKLSQLLQDHMNLKITFEYVDTSDANAWVFIPQINRNNTIFSSGVSGSGYVSEKDIKQALESEKWIEGVVDIKRGRVGGCFSKLITSVHVTRGLLFEKTKDGLYQFTEGEVAAILLHEFGHLFSFLESMVRTQRKNWILESRMNEFVKTDDDKIKVRIISDLKAEKVLGKEFDETTIIGNDKEKCSLLVIAACEKKIYSDPDTVCHDQTAFESAADQFAVRMGAGKELTTALSKLYTQYLLLQKFMYYRNQYVIIMYLGSTLAAIFTRTLTLGAAIWAPVILAVIIFAGSMSMFGVYDTSEDRMDRILQEMITPFKDRSIPDEVRKSMLENYEAVKEEVAKYKKLSVPDNNWDIKQWIAQVCIPALGRNKNSKEYQQLVESLQHNELYVAAAKFQ